MQTRVRRIHVLAAGLLGAALLTGCPSAGDDSCEPPDDPATPELDVSICAPGAGPFSTTLDNEFFPLTIGSAHVLEGTEDGVLVRVEITALLDTMLVAGVTTRVVEEYETEDGEVVEISRNFMVQTTDGTLCYYGETVDDYEDGVIVGHSGEWQAGVDGALPGILMPSVPAVNQWYRQETAVGVAEDRALHTAMGESVTVNGVTYTDTLTVFEWSPLECGHSDKVYARKDRKSVV